MLIVGGNGSQRVRHMDPRNAAQMDGRGYGLPIDSATPDWQPGNMLLREERLHTCCLALQETIQALLAFG